MSEGRRPPELVVPERDDEATFIVTSGPMRSGKTSVAVQYAWSLIAGGRDAYAYRPEQDLRSEAPYIRPQSESIPPIDAQRVRTLGGLMLNSAMSDRFVLLDEPFFWSDPNSENDAPDSDSVEWVRQRVLDGELVIISTLDKSYMNKQFGWYEAMLEIGAELERAGGHFQLERMQGVCELCPGDDLSQWQRSTSTNLYIDGQRILDGKPNVPEDPARTKFVPCCDGCRERVDELPASYSPRFTFIEAA